VSTTPSYQFCFSFDREFPGWTRTTRARVPIVHRDRSSFAALPGLAAAALVVAAALPLGALVPSLGAPIVALALGILASAVHRPPAALEAGLRVGGRTVLQAAIVVLGATLGLGSVAAAGSQTLPVLAGTLAAALLATLVGARLLHVSVRLRTLIGVGTGICGASAIAAVSGIVAATEAEIAYAVTTVFVFNLVAVLLFPPVGHLLGLGQASFGLWAGTAVNDTSSVVAAAYAYGNAAGAHAVVVKLTRTLAILPVAGALTLLARRRPAADARTPSWRAIVPWFLLWFVAASALETVGAVPRALDGALHELAVVLIALALASIGLQTRVRDLCRAGHRPLLLGTLVWAAVATTSLAIQAATGAW
jgi:uncharacterized integral membrane protein (TIGR00698 family)